MCGRSLADRCQRAGCDARYSPLPGLPRSNGTTASRHRRPQVPLSRNYRRAMHPAMAGAGERPLGPIRRPASMACCKASSRVRPIASSSPANREHHAIATASAIDQNAYLVVLLMLPISSMPSRLRHVDRDHGAGDRRRGGAVDLTATPVGAGPGGIILDIPPRSPPLPRSHRATASTPVAP